MARKSAQKITNHSKNDWDAGTRLLMLVVLNLSGSASGCDLNTAYYSNNSDYKDEWVLNRMLPTNGYELNYSPNDWSGIIEPLTNCFQYMLNCQAKPWSPTQPWIFAQPGDYSHNSIIGYESDPDIIVYAVDNDVNYYNEEFNTTKIFEPIEKYDICPLGSYKVALVIGEYPINNNETGYDYHWYRQDSDGLWSHKRGGSPVTRIDSATRYIIDPELASRNYPDCNYSTFVGFFAVTPWNHMWGNMTDSLVLTDLSDRERVILYLSSIGAQTISGRAVYTLNIDESKRLKFDCDNMDGFIDFGGAFVPIDEEFMINRPH